MMVISAPEHPLARAAEARERSRRSMLQLSRRGDLLVNVHRDREVEHAEAEGREDDRPAGRDLDSTVEHVVQGSGKEVAVAGELLGQVRRRIGLQAVLDVVDDVRRVEQNVRREVAQRHVQDERVVVEPARVGDVRPRGDRREHDQVARADQRPGVGVRGRPSRPSRYARRYSPESGRRSRSTGRGRRSPRTTSRFRRERCGCSGRSGPVPKKPTLVGRPRSRLILVGRERRHGGRPDGADHRRLRGTRRDNRCRGR